MTGVSEILVKASGALRLETRAGRAFVKTLRLLQRIARNCEYLSLVLPEHIVGLRLNGQAIILGVANRAPDVTLAFIRLQTLEFK